jgi:hypothetical protein
MQLKDIVDKCLKDHNRSLSWLAAEMDKTFDGLKLSLVKGSIKYNDIKRMADILKVPASCFFEVDIETGNVLEEEKGQYSNLKTELTSCKELTAALKSQLADKDKIIGLLSNQR